MISSLINKNMELWGGGKKNGQVMKSKKKKKSDPEAQKRTNIYRILKKTKTNSNKT